MLRSEVEDSLAAQISLAFLHCFPWRLHFSMLDYFREDGRDGRQAKLRSTTSIAEHRIKLSAFAIKPSTIKPSTIKPSAAKAFTDLTIVEPLLVFQAFYFHLFSDCFRVLLHLAPAGPKSLISQHIWYDCCISQVYRIKSLYSTSHDIPVYSIISYCSTLSPILSH